MEIKSTMIRNRSTQGGNHSTTGTDESIKHGGDQEEHFTRNRVARGNPGKMAIKPELPYDDNDPNAAVIAGKRHNGVKEKSFVPNEARNEPRFEHPDKRFDPACIKV